MKRTYPLISVVVLNYNGLKYLRRTIPVILDLNYSNYEVIVVDNGSIDGSLEYLKGFKKIKLIRSPRLREKNFACNYGIDKSKGDYVLLMDNDALLVDKGILNDLLEQYTFNERTGVIGLAYFNENQERSISYGCYYSHKLPSALESTKIKSFNNCYIGYCSGLALFIKKSIWVHVGGYDDFLKFGGDDSDLGMKLWIMGYKNYLYSKSIQIHIGMFERDNNSKYALKFKEVVYANLFTIVKNYKFVNMIVILILHSFFNFLKSIKQSIFRLDIYPFVSFFSGYYLFLKNLPVAVKKRKEIQSKRVIKDDIFLKIKPPEVKAYD